jgi:DNA-binding HxlR family transcriptional regulator
MINLNMFFDNKLSWTAKGILAYLTFNHKGSASFTELKEFSTESSAALTSGLNELINHGYCEVITKRCSNGIVESVRYYKTERT